MIAAVFLFSPHAASLQLPAQFPQKVLCIHVTGDELGTLAHEFRQNLFSIPVDRCHLNQLDDASPCVAYVVRFAPRRLQLSRPLTDQLTLQRPPLLIGQIRYSDPEHDSLLTACQKPLTSEARARRPFNVL
jgi:hypothetical protein